MKLLWLGYLVYSLGNCAIKLWIETEKLYLGAISSSVDPSGSKNQFMSLIKG